MKFEDFPLHDKILDGIRDIGFTEPTPVQAETFGLLFQGKDIEAQSQTGTGKTAAFLIGGFHLLMSDPKFQGRKMLVVAPTRELADQIEKEALLIGKHLKLRIGAFYGGVGYAQQEKLLSEGVDVMIGTPGRLLDFAGSGKVSFHDVGVLVIDEADRLFDMGFYPDLRQMLRTMSDPEDRRTMLFSATLSSQVMNLAWEYLKDPGQIVIEPENVTVDRIRQELYHVASDEKFGVLLSLLQEFKNKTAIIFTNTKHTAIQVAKRLELNGFSVEFIMGDLPQSKRLKIIEDLKAGRLPFLVATDVAARGLHINDLDLVVNYDLPLEAENYVHRIGRTARAGKEGRAVSLACEKYVYGLKAIEEYIHNKIPVAWFEEGQLVEDKSRGVPIRIEEDSRGPRGPRGRQPLRSESRERGPRGPRRDKPMTIRSSSLVNEATGVRSMEGGKVEGPKRDRKLGRDDKERTVNPERTSTQGERIAAAAAAVGTARPKGHRNLRNTPRKAEARQEAPRTEKRPENRRESRPEVRRDSPVRRDPRGENHRDKKPVAAKSGSGIQDRLDYYKSKYGEDFKAVHVAPEKKSKQGLLDRLASALGLKKK
ncbi:MAG: DEAD/DEAH box helicase [Spirochaetales bacterium]|nr:DEAD/DEAH box helicase [Spirochaetales bacterium]